ncbi:SGNH/GDSL hydrolase family protein [Nonomuraea sp. B12E4]|uniref:SGNH/GDSL hydrolase family protein n=1 Tax=Nonomuraea sp. B12E4 TaxID=3153564 RepID=UPI00325CDE82
MAISGCGGTVAGNGLSRPVSTSAAPAKAPVMMFVGDSFTVGSGPVPEWETYATGAARRLGWQPVIAGAGGTGFVNEGRVGRTFRESFEVELAWRPAPDLLVISGGHNDRRWSAERVRHAAERLLARVRAHWPATRVVVVGPIWLADAPGKAYEVRDAVARAAVRAGVAFLDPLDRRWVTGKRSKVVLPDGVHPTRAGHEHLAAWLAAKLS